MNSTGIDGCRGGKRWKRLRSLFCSSRGAVGERGSRGWDPLADSLGEYAGRRARGVGVKTGSVARRRSRNVEGELHMGFFFEASSVAASGGEQLFGSWGEER